MEMDISALRRVDESIAEKNTSRPHGSIGATVEASSGVVGCCWGRDNCLAVTVDKAQGQIGCVES
jgi:hypothetical protein